VCPSQDGGDRHGPGDTEDRRGSEECEILAEAMHSLYSNAMEVPSAT